MVPSWRLRREEGKSGGASGSAILFDLCAGGGGVRLGQGAAGLGSLYDMAGNPKVGYIDEFSQVLRGRCSEVCIWNGEQGEGWTILALCAESRGGIVHGRGEMHHGSAKHDDDGDTLCKVGNGGDDECRGRAETVDGRATSRKVSCSFSKTPATIIM